MKENSNKSAINIVTAILVGLLIAKALWLFVEYKYLPKKGIDLPKESGVKKLYYHYTLASKQEKQKVVEKTNKPKPKPKPQEFTKFILKGLYNASDKKIILVEYQGKSYALSLGEELQKYKFIKLYPNYAIFKKDGKEYKLNLASKKSNNSSNTTPTQVPQQPQNIAQDNNNSQEEPKTEGGVTYIPKNLFNKYKNNVGQIQRNINAVPNMENGKLNGFKVSFVRKGSDFSKIGLKSGDIIMAINGEPLDNFKVPLEFFKNINTITAATITVKRGNETKELEYEVR